MIRSDTPTGSRQHSPASARTTRLRTWLLGGTAVVATSLASPPSWAEGDPGTADGRRGVLACGAHIEGAEAFQSNLTFVERDGRWRAERPTGSRPGRNRFEVVTRPDGHVAVRGTGSYDNGRSWRWSLAGDGSAGGRVTAMGYMLQAGRDGVERRARTCTLTLDLTPRLEAPTLADRLARPSPRVRDAEASPPERAAPPAGPPAPVSPPRPLIAEAAPAPAPDLAPSPAFRVSDIPCSAFYRMDGGLTEQAWRLVSPVPLDRLSPDDVEELKRVTTACYHARPYPRMEERIAVNRVRSGLDRLASTARKRAEEEELAANARAEAEATAKAQSTIADGIATALRGLNDKPSAERCAPNPSDLRAGLVASYGAATFAEFGESLPAWAAYREGCTVRDRLAAQEEAERIRAELEERVVAVSGRLIDSGDQSCQPTPAALQAELSASAGVPAFQSFAAQSPAWSALTRDCAARIERAAARAREAARAALDQRIAAAVRAQMVKPLDEPCVPTPATLQTDLSTQHGRETVAPVLSGSNDWTLLTAECTRREARAETARVQDAQRRAAELQARRRKLVADQVAGARARHAEEIAALDLPERLLDTHLVLEISPLFLGGWSFDALTLADWIALIVDAQPDTRITGASDLASGNIGFTVKRPSERSTTYFVRLDGDELFTAAVQIDGVAVPVSDIADRAAVANQLLILAALPDLIARTQQVQ